MLTKKRTFWLVVGSQHLYGDETLMEVRKNAASIVENLNKEANLPYVLILKEVLTRAEEITTIMKEANYQEEVDGVFTWMHTFYPVKIWLHGSKLLQTPLFHFATQHHREIR